jgi:hypothetical protein
MALSKSKSSEEVKGREVPCADQGWKCLELGLEELLQRLMGGDDCGRCPGEDDKDFQFYINTKIPISKGDKIKSLYVRGRVNHTHF